MSKAGSKACDIYEVAVYLRLSRDDHDGNDSKTESNSIANQRELIRMFIRDHEDMRIYDIYVDDGYSGSNFERPEFKRMMEDVNAGKVNCIIVKDLSRFGRDYIEAGRFIQRTFPAIGVRFIAITDHYDSLTADKAESSLILPVKNFVNDSYCRDISQKVRAHQKVKRQKGEFIGAFAVYGYEKGADNKNQLVIDEYAGDVVKKIFAWKIEGMSLGAIANKLNDLHILSPMEYKKSKGLRFRTGFEGGTEARWAATSVKRVLTNPVYIGRLIQGKQEKINYKVKKKVDKPESEWDCVENTHEAIICEEDFNIVQNLLKYDGRASAHSDLAHLFSGILICADCKAPMIKRVNTYKGNRKVFYICQTKNKSLGCSRHSIAEEKLEQIVLREIQVYTALLMDYQEVAESLKELEVNYEQVVEYDVQISRLQKEYDRNHALKTTLYHDLKEGLIDKEEFEEFHSLYEDKCNELMKAMENQKKIIRNMFKNGISAGMQLEEMKKSFTIPALERSILVTAVSKILVHEDKRIELVFRYADILEKMDTVRHFCQEQKKAVV